ncbi:hypothetical protein ACB092_10G072500 [Castanea dentata]
MNLKILSWKVRGLNVVEKRLQIRNLLRTWRADIVCLQETKLEWITRGIVRSIWGCPYVDWLYQGSKGSSEGVYGPNLNKRRRKMWKKLTGLISWWDLSWCLGGDFNIIRFPSERLGAASCTRAMYGFSDFISLHELMDIPMDGGLYTWSNTSSTSRIDRFLFSPLLADHYTMFT